jgi:putative membrane protein
MIRDFNDHAANERTFLAWVRTAMAVVAVGFVIEKFNLFLRGYRSAGASGPPHPVTTSPGHIEGLALIFGGVALIALATVRFIRLTRRLDDPAQHEAASIRTELILSALLVALIGGYSLYLALG